MSMLLQISKSHNIILFSSILLALSLVVGSTIWDMSRERLILSTTTSTHDTGLLDYLIPMFESKYHIKIDVISQGTGQAIETARRGDADIVLVHSRTAEEVFVNGGDGMHRVGIMYNDFIIVGPSNDPAGIRGKTNATEALTKIFNVGTQGRTFFISRGDNSGTHLKEKAIWAKTGLTPIGSWYLETGRGMGDVLTTTNEKQGYTLSDRGTWLSFKANLNLEVMVEGDEFLLNPYAVILVNPEKHSHVNYSEALHFVKFMVSSDGQYFIENFKVGGETLFIPIARNYSYSKILGFPSQEAEVAWYDSKQ